MRAGWWQAPVGMNAYEIGKLLQNADHSLTYMVDEQHGEFSIRSLTLLVGPKSTT